MKNLQILKRPFLVIEDDREISATVQSVLSAAGYKVWLHPTTGWASFDSKPETGSGFNGYDDAADGRFSRA